VTRFWSGTRSGLGGFEVALGLQRGNIREQQAIRSRLGRIAQPVLIVRATDDPFAAPHAAELQHHLPQARIVDIEGGMVPLPDQMPDTFARTVLDFLATLP